MDLDVPDGFSAFYALGALLFVTPVVFGAVDFFKEIILWFFGGIVSGASGLAGWFTTRTIEVVLFFPPPGDFTALTQLYWGVTFPLFWGLLSLVGAAFFGLMQLFPESDKASVDRFMQRTLIAVVLLFIFGQGFDLLVESIMLIQGELYPDEFRINVGIDTMEGMATVGLAGFSVVIFAIIASTKIFITYALFLTMLGMRMILTYSTYVLFPVLIAFWIVDIGPMKYGKMMAGLMFKATIFLLLFGILISGILGVGGAIAGDATTEQFEDEEFDPDSLEDDVLGSDIEGEEDRLEHGIYEGDSVQLSGEGQSALTSAWTSVFTFYASIWLCISLTSLLLGGSISTGFTKQMIRGGKMTNAARKASQRVKEKRKSMGSGSAGAGGAGGAPTTPDQAGGRQSGTQQQGGDTAQAPDSAPEPDTDQVSETPGGEDMGRIAKARQRVHSAKERASDAKQQGAEAVNKAAEKGSELGDKVESGATEVGSKAGPVGAAAGKVAGKAGNLGITAASYTPKAAMKGANLAKRGSKAYWNVFKQPDAMSSIGEMGRIARESPIGKPSKPDGAENAPVDPAESEAVDDVEDYDTSEPETVDDSGAEDGHGEDGERDSLFDGVDESWDIPSSGSGGDTAGGGGDIPEDDDDTR